MSCWEKAWERGVDGHRLWQTFIPHPSLLLWKNIFPNSIILDLAKYLVSLFSLGSPDGEQHMLGLLPCSHIHTPTHIHITPIHLFDSKGRDADWRFWGSICKCVASRLSSSGPAVSQGGAGMITETMHGEGQGHCPVHPTGGSLLMACVSVGRGWLSHPLALVRNEKWSWAEGLALYPIPALLHTLWILWTSVSSPIEGQLLKRMAVTSRNWCKKNLSTAPSQKSNEIGQNQRRGQGHGKHGNQQHRETTSQSS